ncbi:hypothetical protein D3C75_1335270 [compost metagenome]
MHVVVKQNLVPIAQLDVGKILVRHIHRERARRAIANHADVAHLGERQGIVDKLRGLGIVGF